MRQKCGRIQRAWRASRLNRSKAGSVCLTNLTAPAAGPGGGPAAWLALCERRSPSAPSPTETSPAASTAVPASRRRGWLGSRGRMLRQRLPRFRMANPVRRNTPALGRVHRALRTLTPCVHAGVGQTSDAGRAEARPRIRHFVRARRPCPGRGAETRTRRPRYSGHVAATGTGHVGTRSSPTSTSGDAARAAAPRSSRSSGSSGRSATARSSEGALRPESRRPRGRGHAGRRASRARPRGPPDVAGGPAPRGRDAAQMIAGN